MVRDVFIEEIVKKKKEGRDWVFAILVGTFCAVIAVASIFLGLFFPFFLVLAALSVYFGYFFISRRWQVEYEYSLTNDLLDIDMIYAKRSRKRLLSTSCKNIDSLGPYNPEEHIHKKYAKTYYCCTGLKADNLWYIVSRGSSEGNSLYVFNASERMLEGLRSQIPYQMSIEVFGRK